MNIESYALVPHVVCNINENKFLSAYARVLAVTLHRDETRLGHFRFHPKIMGERLGFKACTMAKAFKELIRIGFCVAEEVRMIGKMTTKSLFDCELEASMPRAPQVSAQASPPTPLAEPKQLDIEEAIAQRSQASEKKKVPLPVHLCDGKYTLLGSETQLNKESLAVLEEVLKRDEPVRNPNDPIPPTLAKYCNKMMLKMNDHGILQGNQIRFAYWRLKETPLPELMQSFMNDHMRELEAVLGAMS